MGIAYRVFTDPKLGNDPAENEDAAWPSQATAAPGTSRYAVADGATESSYSRQWAEVLVRGYAEGATRPGALANRMESLRERWRAQLPTVALPWYAEQKLQQGAFATLLGVRVTLAPDGAHLRCLAVGDSCLVVVRRDLLALSWPIAQSSQFGLHPALLCSVPLEEARRPPVLGRRIRLRAGDSVFLMTDAVAAWFLARAESGERPWHQLQTFGFGEDDAFVQWARDLRTRGLMRNDDVTVSIVQPS